MNEPRNSFLRDIGIVLLASILTGALSTYATVQVTRSEIRWIRRDLRHESRRIDRTQQAVKALYSVCNGGPRE